MSATLNSKGLAVDRLEIASDWLIRLHEESLSDAEVAEWIQWCESDADNLAAFEEMQATWKGFGELPEAVRLRMMAQGNRAGQSPANSRSRMRELFAGWRWAPTAAAVALLVVASSIVWWRGQSEILPPQIATNSLQTAAAVNEEATLPDGSILALGAKSAITIDFAGTERRLRMRDGQAYFKVRPNRQRPFIVDAGPIHVRAVGTAFDVRKNEDRVVVSVTEGIVEILPSEDTDMVSGVAKETRLQVVAGFQLTWAEGGREVKLTPTDPASATAWRMGRLEYFGEPLRVVIANVNRYSARPIVIADEDIGQLQFTGTVFVRSIDDWVAALQQAFPVTCEPQADGSVVIKHRASPPARSAVSVS